MSDRGDVIEALLRQQGRAPQRNAQDHVIGALMRIQEQDQNRIGRDFQRSPPHPPTMMPRTDADVDPPRLGEAFRSGLPFIDSPIQTALRGVDPATLSPLEQALYQKPYGLLDSEPFVPREGPEQVMNVLGMSVPIAAGGAAMVPGRLAFPAFAAEMGIARLGEEGHQRGLGGLAQMFAEGAASLVAPGTAGAAALKHAVIPAFVGSGNRWTGNPLLNRLTSRLDKMSTGEGVQAFTWGNYSASRKGVAQSYSELGSTSMTVGGVEADIGWFPGSDLSMANRKLHDAIENNGGDVEKGIAEARLYMKRLIQAQRGAEAGQRANGIIKPPSDELVRLERQTEVMEKLIEKGIAFKDNRHLYGVLHDVNHDDLLDLDLPMGKQSPQVRAALMNFDEIKGSGKILEDELELMTTDEIESMLAQIDSNGDFGQLDELGELTDPDQWREDLIAIAKDMDDDGELTDYLFGEMGQDSTAQTMDGFYKQLVHRTGSPEAASRKLAEAGIPGAQYFDGVSRNGGPDMIGRLEVRHTPGGKYNVTTNAGTPYGSFDTREAAQSFADAGGRSRNYVMYRDDLTYLDKSRTPKHLWEGQNVGEPFRTVDRNVPGPEMDRDMAHLLRGKSEVEQIGQETGEVVENGVSHLVSPDGSHRYVMTKDGEIVGALQVVSRDGKEGLSTGMMVNPNQRGSGVMSKLMDAAEKDFDSVVSAGDRSGSADAFWNARRPEQYKKPRTPKHRPPLSLEGGEKGIAAATRGLLRGELDPMSYSGTRLDRPVSEVNVGIDPTTPNAPRQELNFEDLEGDYLLPFFGDRSARGGMVTSIDGNQLANPVYREGGPDFMVGPAADTGSIWASDSGIITRLQNRANALGQGGEGVAGVTVAMGPQAVDYTGFAARVAAEQIPGAKITKKAKKAFDVQMKKVDQGWPGVGSVGLSAYLEAAPAGVRKHFMRVMDQAPAQAAGFPSVGKARRAVTEPDLYDTPTGSAGFSIGRLNPGAAPITDPSVPHGTYKAQMEGQYLGGLPQQLPKEVLWRDFYKGLEGRRTKAGKPLSPAQKKYIMNLEMPGQRVDAALVDTVMELLRKQQP